ncbi:hypothetical protein PVAND_003253 [Polypedilum vanderplanki]|uniref:Uncharacterized protein n=1 Tax=Polypedilum vanderplanki TaxID=319348 RepID=A0A9J6BTY6_POLVA|nr:hypothetical protein PVAND_003253 [Polypedilum vanderplanki]
MKFFLSIILLIVVSANGKSLKDAFLLCDFDESRANCEIFTDNWNDEVEIKSIFRKNFNTNLTNESIDPKLLQEKVKFMKISKTQMTSNLPQNIENHFKNLESLRVTQTNLKFIARKSLKNFTNLRHLSLDSNKIEIIYNDAFHDLTNLISLFISNNKIDFLHPQLFVNSPKLRYFWSDYNQIEKVEENLFKNNKNIEWINLSRNKIENIEIDFRKFKKLFYINLEKNRGSCNLIFDKFQNDNESAKIESFQDNVEKFCKK